MGQFDVIRFNKPINEVLRKKIEPFTLQVGILKDKPHMLPIRKKGTKLKKFAGGVARKVSRQKSGKTIAEVSAEARKQLGVNYLTKPFKGSRKNADAIRMMNVFWKLVFGEGKLASKRRLEKRDASRCQKSNHASGLRQEQKVNREN
jgi:predicted adenine nucleotide alpha hydrolase (AANH) superfamily ATPase